MSLLPNKILVAPCPFCGAEIDADEDVEFFSTDDNDDGTDSDPDVFGDRYFSISCPDCPATMTSYNFSDVLSSWNTRADIPFDPKIITRPAPSDP